MAEDNDEQKPLVAVGTTTVREYDMMIVTLTTTHGMQGQEI